MYMFLESPEKQVTNVLLQKYSALFNSYSTYFQVINNHLHTLRYVAAHTRSSLASVGICLRHIQQQMDSDQI
jgi:hypothetical protein